MHKDPYQNIFCQIVGEKQFVLISPLESACVNEQFLQPATWVEKDGQLVLQIDGEDEPRVPCALWDPDFPRLNRGVLSDACRPIRVTLEAGDLLYLPAMWFVLASHPKYQ